MPTLRSIRRKQWREQPDTIYLDPLQSAMIKQPGSREGGTVASGRLGPSSNHGSRQPAADEGPWRLSYLDAGRRFIVADSIRNLGQEDRAVVMSNQMIDAKPARMLDAGHRNPLTNDFT